ncbi:hypothetical protein L9G15_23200, partial [Shewanella sp. A3A]|nr:hypothetical protein [Shewanella ferrihydritica]
LALDAIQDDRGDRAAAGTILQGGEKACASRALDAVIQQCLEEIVGRECAGCGLPRWLGFILAEVILQS